MSKKVKLIESIMAILREKNSKQDDAYFAFMFDTLSEQTDVRLECYLNIIEKL